MTTYYLQLGTYAARRGVFFNSRAKTARGLYRAALKAAGSSVETGLRYGSRICKTETAGDITRACPWRWVTLDFDGNYFY